MVEPRTERDGYTLIELVVVMAIVSVMIMVTGPKFMPRLFETRLETSARRLAAMTKYLHAHTALDRGEATLFIDVANGEYWVTTPPGEDEDETEDETDGSTPEFGIDTMQDIDFEIDFGPQIVGDEDVLGLDFDLDELIESDDEEERVELATSFIARTKLMEGVHFAGLLVPNADTETEETEFEIQYGPFGLTSAAYIVIEDDRGKMLGVKLDPVLGQSTVEVPDPQLLSTLGIASNTTGGGMDTVSDTMLRMEKQIAR